ncbi:MAG: DUF4834 family protein [Tannerellaceae bacterium]|jgi:hypothetical protein|nr:DUF4834 family protein [Tannerellaceae bacterium]
MIRIVLFLFFFFLLLMFLMGFSVVRMFRNMLFGNGANERKPGQQQRPGNKKNAGQSRTSRQPQDAPPRRKLFPKDEGEYVDYEEVKE